MSQASVCLVCKQGDRPGSRYTGVSPFGLALRPFFVCQGCAAKGFSAKACAACGAPEGPARPGNPFTISGPAGHKLSPFFLCNDCAPFEGPEQGITQTFKDELKRQGRS